MSSSLRKAILCSLAAFVFAPLSSAFAGDVSLTLRVTARNDIVNVSVTNTGRNPAGNVVIRTELESNVYEKPLENALSPGATAATSFQVTYPGHDGTYPLLTTASYTNEGIKLSVIDAGFFYYRRRTELEADCGPQIPIRLTDEKTITVRHDEKYRVRVFLPEEIKLEGRSPVPGGTQFTLVNTKPAFSSNYAVFTVLQSPETWPVQSTKLCPNRLITGQAFARKSLFPAPLLLVFALLGVVFSGFVYRRKPLSAFTRLDITLARYGFTVFLVSLLYFGFRRAHVIADFVLPKLYNYRPAGMIAGWLYGGSETVLKWLYFQGQEYDYFFSYAADPLYLYILLLNGFVLWFVIKPDKGEKYFQLLRTFFSLPLLRLLNGKNEHEIYWSKSSKIALLSLMVKTFYLPMLISWAINQTFHCRNLGLHLRFNFFAVNALVVELMILLDVVIFACGYLTELPQLRNRIRSVEPTLLGWAVCLMCYPPFNSFSFQLVDHPLNEEWSRTSPGTGILVQVLTTLLWGLYVWASVALGFRASNLTNRGIVKTGPYRFMRHPAYVSKVSVWTLSSFFFGQKNFFLIISLIIVYSLRAWTEERHLSRDPDYLEYKKEVRWRFLPHIW